MLDAKKQISSAKAVIAQLNVVPDDHRVFETSVQDAQFYGLSAELLDELIALGLSHRQRPEGLFLDSDDLYNVSLYLNMPSVHKMAMRSWAKAFRKAGQTRRLTVSYGLQETSVIPKRCEVLSAHSGYIAVDVTDPSVIFEETVDLTPPAARLPDNLTNRLRQITQGFAFYMLHDAIRWNIPFMESHQIAECGGYSKLIVREARSLGYVARHVFGILASPPFGIGHYWAEVQIGGEWIKLDPLMIQLLVRQGLLDPAVFGPDFSPSGALLTLAVVSDYDAIGAPILTGQRTPHFIKEPVILVEGLGQPISISVISEDQVQNLSRLSKPS